MVERPFIVSQMGLWFRALKIQRQVKIRIRMPEGVSGISGAV
jgi:hypothetical protein